MNCGTTLAAAQFRRLVKSARSGCPAPAGDRYLAMGRDLTEEKVLTQLAQARDESERANRAKSRFSCRLPAAESLRQPIPGNQPVPGGLEQDRSGHGTEAGIDCLSRSAQSLSDILTELIMFSKAWSGGAQPSLKPLRADVFRSIGMEFAPLALAKTFAPPILLGCYGEKAPASHRPSAATESPAEPTSTMHFKYAPGPGVLIGPACPRHATP